MLCLLQFKVDSERQIFEKLFMAILFTLRVFARDLLRGNRRRNNFCISFWCLAWDSNPSFSSNKPTHYQLDHGDFQMSLQPKFNHVWFPIHSVAWEPPNIMWSKYVLVYQNIELHWYFFFFKKRIWYWIKMFSFQFFFLFINLIIWTYNFHVFIVIIIVLFTFCYCL